MSRCLALGERLYLHRAIGRPEGVSRATLQNALGCFRDRGIVTEQDGALHAARPAREVAAEIGFFLA